MHSCRAFCIHLPSQPMAFHAVQSAVKSSSQTFAVDHATPPVVGVTVLAVSLDLLPRLNYSGRLTPALSPHHLLHVSFIPFHPFLLPSFHSFISFHLFPSIPSLESSSPKCWYQPNLRNSISHSFFSAFTSSFCLHLPS